MWGGMKYEVVQCDEGWVVQSEGVELARVPQQAAALDDVAVRLRELDPGEEAVSLKVRYQARD